MHLIVRYLGRYFCIENISVTRKLAYENAIILDQKKKQKERKCYHHLWLLFNTSFSQSVRMCVCAHIEEKGWGNGGVRKVYKHLFP